MEITYIHHSSFTADLECTAFPSDYLEGGIPEIPEDKPLFVFASHRHGDHFPRSIFDLLDGRRKVTCVLSDDIWRRQVPDELLGRTTFMGPDESGYLADGTGQPLEIEAFKSTGEGVTFLIKADGQIIYHAGDLNNWVWGDEPERDSQRMSENYHKGLAKLAGRYIDVAFMLIDPRQEKDFCLGMDDFMRMVGTDVVFLMHFWGDFGAASRFKALPCAKSYRDRIHEIRKKGESSII